MSNQIVISSGAKVRELEGVLTGTSGIVSSVPLGAANGVATLDSGGKVPVSQLPSSVVTYLGTWNAATNTPTLVNGTGDAGDMYICNVQGTVNFGAGPVTFAVGDWVLYGSGTWQKSSGQNGTVTSVAASITGNAVGLTGSPITTAGTLAFAFAGTNLQYVNGAGNLTTFPTLITSIGLSMPSAFSVANSPLTANGTIAVTGAGTTAQYIRGDGSLATFPTIATEAQRLITEVYNETGATLTKGTVVYINGGHGNLPTITKAIATGDATSAQTYGIVQTDITNMNNGYVVVIGSLGDLDTQAYANGTQLYLSSTTAGAWTSVKQYAPAHLVYVGIVTRSHPTQGVVEVRIQNGFEMDELHNVSAQSPLNNQGLFYNTSTSLWENKSIATALGYTPANDASVVHLTGNETIGGTKTFSDATKNNGGILLQNASSSSLAGYMNVGGLTNGVKFTSGGGVSNTFTLPSATGYTFTFPNATGTLALTSDIPSITGLVPYTGATTNVNLGSNSLTAFNLYSKAIFANNSGGTSGGAIALSLGTTFNSYSGFNTISAAANGVFVFSSDISSGAAYKDARFDFGSLTNSTIRTYTFPDASGTIALVGGSGVGTVTSVAALTIGTSGTDLSSTVANSTTTPVITLNVPTASATNRGALSSADWTTFNNKQGTITLTTTGTSGAATFSANTLNIPNYGSALSGYVPYTGATTNVNLGSYGITASYLTATGGITIQGSGSSIQSGNGLRFYRTDNAIYTNLYDAGTYFALDNRNGNGFDFQSAGTSQMKLNASGNLGLGVTPSAWNSNYRSLEVGASGSGIMSKFGESNIYFGTNYYYNNSGQYIYSYTDNASYYQQNSGQHKWFNAPSGTAGNAITFTQAMTLTAAGRLLIGTPTESTYLLDVNGTGRFSSSVNIGGVTDIQSARTVQLTLLKLSTTTLSSDVNDEVSIDFGRGALSKYSGRISGYLSNYSTYDGGLKFYSSTSGTLNATPSLTIASTGAATFSGNVGIKISGRSESLAIEHTTGNVSAGFFYTSGITTGQSYGLTVHAGTNSSDRSFLVSNQGGGTEYFKIRGDGAITAYGSITAASFFESSDSRLKTIIQDNYQTKGIASITPKLYTKNGKVELGYYAQDFVGILDSAVSKGEDDMLSLSYREVLVAKVYALEQRIKELENK